MDSSKAEQNESKVDSKLKDVPQESIAFKAGREAKEQGIPLRKSALKNLRPESRQYEKFLDGYEAGKRKRN